MYLSPMIRSIAVLAAFLITGCVGRQAYYVHPFNGLSQPFRTLPHHRDSVRSATYIQAALASGDANDYGLDRKFAGSANLSRSWNFGTFQGHAGLGFAAGNYRVSPYDTFGINNATVNTRYLNERIGRYTFSGITADGAINARADMGRGEWRFLGIEAALSREYGRYLQFRETLPDSVATLVVRSPWYASGGLTTEFVFGDPDRNWGFRFAYGTTIGNNYRRYSGPDNTVFPRTLSFNYFNTAFQMTFDKVSFFAQGNLAEKAHSFLFGANVRIGK